jgi:hypothetical protein
MEYGNGRLTGNADRGRRAASCQTHAKAVAAYQNCMAENITFGKQ